MPLLLLPLLTCCAQPPASALPALSPSIQADADYLLTTTDFMDAQFGMAVEGVEQANGRITVRTTGAEIDFDRGPGVIRLRQRLARPRETATFTAGPESLDGLRVERQGTGAVLLSGREGKLQVRVNGDSLVMIRCAEPLTATLEVGFVPLSVRQYADNFLLLDEYGGVGAFLVTEPSGRLTLEGEGVIECRLPAGQFLWLSVAPPKPYDWEASLRDRVVWHWSRETGYPSDEQIARWSRYGNLLLQQSEVMLWKDWSLRFIPRNGLEEFQRVNRTCEQHGMRNYVYTSPYYFLTGTGLEDKAMNSFDNFEVTGFSPGDPRGLNWPIFLEEITRVVREYQPDGLYFDGIYGNVVRTYLITRKARELVGDQGILEFHGTWSPPGGVVYLPQVDAYFNFILRGEGAMSQYENDEYLRYFVSTYNISNSIGVLCNNTNYPLDGPFIARLLDNNIRLHLIPEWLEDYRKDVMEQLYWPALTDELRARVEAACERRQEEGERSQQVMRQVAERGVEGLTLAFEERFSRPGVWASAAPAPADARPQVLAPAEPSYLELFDGWRAHFSLNSAGTLEAVDGVMVITARENTCAYLDRALPEDVAAVQCKVRCPPGGGMSWGPGLLLSVGENIYRLNARADDRIGIDRRYEQHLLDGYHHSIWYWLRMRLANEYLVSEVSRDGEKWRPVKIESIKGSRGPKRLLVGKISNAGTNAEYSEVGAPGKSYVAEVKVWTTPVAP